MFRKIYDWMMRMAEHPRAETALAGVAFAESSFFPLPPDIMLIPMSLAQRTRAFAYALTATIASVAGGLAGYAIGYFLFEAIGQPILSLYGYGDKFASFADQYNEWGAWIVLMAGITPFPYKVITIASGVTGLSLPVFMLASVVARALRFFAVAALLYWFGAPIREFIERYFGLLTIAFFVLLIGGFALVRFLF